MRAADGETRLRLQDAAAGIDIPSRARRVHEGRPPAPASGQVWRARWQETSVLVLVLERTEPAVLVALVTDASQQAQGSDPLAADLPAQACPLGVPMVVWLGMPREIRVRVLERCFGDVDASWAVTHASTRHGQPHSVTPVAGESDPRAERHAWLADSLAALQSAHRERPNAGQLGLVLAKAGCHAPVLVRELGIRPKAALAVLRGHAPLSPGQARQVARLTGLDADMLITASPLVPEGLSRSLDQPWRRAEVQRLATQLRVDEEAAWREAAYSTWAFSLRSLADRDALSWDRRLDDYFVSVFTS